MAEPLRWNDGRGGERLSPPLERTEIDGIVKCACRYTSGIASPHVNGEVHAELDIFALAVYGARGAGKTEREGHTSPLYMGAL